MHLGEKGFWNKWSLFDEATHVPLIIVDPDIPVDFRGQHYKFPVELLDIFPTLLHMFPYLNRCPSYFHSPTPLHVKCPPLNGKSLAPILYGKPRELEPRSYARAGTGSIARTIRHYSSMLPFFSDIFAPTPELLKLNMTFAISQVMKCAKKRDIENLSEISSRERVNEPQLNFSSPWQHCRTSRVSITADEIKEETSLMGYSFRLRDFQYIIWLHYDRISCKLNYDKPPYAEEYYKAFGIRGGIRNINVIEEVDEIFAAQFRNFAMSILKKKRFFNFRNCFL